MRNKNQKMMILADFLLPFLCCWTLLPSSCDSLPIQSQSAPSISFNTHQWQSLVRDAIKFLQKHQQQQQADAAGEHKSKTRFVVDPSFTGSNNNNGPTGNNGGGTGMVKLRNIRSGYGDISDVVRLVHLHELEKAWASKARPRFGKRAEVTQDNFLPPYAYMVPRDDEYDQEVVLSDSKVPALPDYLQTVGDRKGEHDSFMKYPEDYLISGA
ncbi:uncharacterized protein LOC110852067 [Folsomia candida]|uniref:Uncharacterized protein n=1 Tax=Folsomia candida TaxID=158441 RepID=A0A226E3R5_FOLCA|nr:uncharacterized protein LOC110852067 [Folsomia candida]OXA51920.1 hypothetical protein Fcan01_13128 [Folsomia candida]